MLKVLLAGGGTAGHINPALAISSIIKDHVPDVEFLYAGTPKGMEANLVPDAGLRFTPIKVSGFQRKLTLKNVGRNIRAAAYLASSGSRAKHIINEFKPDLVIGTGGYVSGPIVFEAARMKIPTLIHEQNAYPGVTTKILSKKVDMVMLTVPEAMDYLDKDIPHTVTGLPVRKGFTGKMSREAARRELGFDDGMVILSYGGSLGAGAINDTAERLIEYEQKNGLKINHIHSYGRMGKDTFIKNLEARDVDLNSPRLMIKDYIRNMDVCMAAADLIICRSGASAITELEAEGRASILIPSPVVAGNHQYHNAMVLGKAGAAIVIEQKDLDFDKIIEKVSDFYNNPGKTDVLAQRAAELYIKDTPDRIWEQVAKLVGDKI